jgi:uncharacterized protein YdaT
MPDPTPNNAPATLQDLAAAERRITAAIETAGTQTAEAIAASEARAAEHARDLQTEILKGIEAFARGNFSRFHTLETRAHTTDSNVIDNNTRLAALEERVLYLETRRPPQ